MQNDELPSLIGYHPDEAERIAAEHGVAITWVDTPPPHWLSPHHEPRVGRQRACGAGRVELLRVLVPVLAEEEDSDHGDK